MSQPVENKPAVALLSGLLCDARMWRDVIPSLNAVCSPTPFSFAGCTSIAQMAAKVLDAMPDQFALVGHSMGGRVALEVYRQAPDRIARLALLNTGVHAKRDSEIPGRKKLLDLADEQGMTAVADSWLPPMMSVSGRDDPVLMAELRDMILRHTTEDFHGEIQALLERPDAESVLATVNVPTLLLSGDQDNWSPVAQHADMRRILPSANLVALKGVGHMSTVEAPQKIANALITWLTDNPRE